MVKSNSICLSDKGEKQRYTVWCLYKIKHYIIREEEYPKFRIKKTMNNATTKQNVIEAIKHIQSYRFNGDCYNYAY